MIHLISPSKVVAKLGQQPPENILRLSKEIEIATRVAEQTGDLHMVNTIVRMKLDLDRLYAEWLEAA